MKIGSLIIYDEINDNFIRIIQYIRLNPYTNSFDFYISQHDNRTIFINEYDS